MTITREQATRRQAQAPENWRYDWRYAAIHGEHTIVRTVNVDDTHHIQARAIYRDEYEEFNRWKRTGRQIPTLHVSLYADTGTAFVSHGLGKWFTIGEPEKNKNYKALCKCAADITDEYIMEIYNADRKYLTEGAPLFG